jgi:hypothetical protein
MKRKFKQSSISPISTKQQITCDFGNLCPGLIQAQKYGGLNR